VVSKLIPLFRIEASPVRGLKVVVGLMVRDDDEKRLSYQGSNSVARTKVPTHTQNYSKPRFKFRCPQPEKALTFRLLTIRLMCSLPPSVALAC
jgi:hypothetical protein